MTVAIQKPMTEASSYEHFYVARQPIFDHKNNTYGYELLFRSGRDKTSADVIDQDYATLCVATCGFIKSQECLDQTKKIFINFTENLIMDQVPRGLPPSVTVVELLEHIIPSPPFIREVISLKQDGYIVALDDYEGASVHDEFLELADIIKVDIFDKSFEEIKAIHSKIIDKKALKLAEKVDNRETLDFLKSLGFDLYQGYYFAKPENLSGKTLRSGQLSRLRILQVINDPDLGPDKLVDIIKVDPGITYQLLRFVNSAAFGFTIKIDSVGHAVTLLGTKRLKYWVRMAVMSELMGDDKTPELYFMALNRGRLLEELAADGMIRGISPDTLFLFGMLSLIDTMLDVPLEKVLDELPLSKEIVTGYVDEGSQFNKYLQLIKAVENLQTNKIKVLCNDLRLREKGVADASLRSTAWTNSMATTLADC